MISASPYLGFLERGELHDLVAKPRARRGRLPAALREEGQRHGLFVVGQRFAVHRRQALRGRAALQPEMEEALALVVAR